MSITQVYRPMVETIGLCSSSGLLASASVTFRCKSVRHREFLKFEIFDVWPLVWSDFASST